MNKKILLVISFAILALVGMSLWEFASLEARSTLYWGTRNGDVTTLQNRLKQWGYYEGPVSGYYGPQTYNAVKNFQRKNGLKQDGVVGSRTWQALGLSGAGGGEQAQAQQAAPQQTTPQKTPPQQGESKGVKGITNNNDVHLLARLVFAEAEAEPYQGQVAVAAVILNRVRSAEFPNTVAGNVYKPGEFESVMNGRASSNNPDDSSYKAARDALNGFDPTQGSLFFFNPDKYMSSDYFRNKPVLLKIGRHAFVK